MLEGRSWRSKNSAPLVEFIRALRGHRGAEGRTTFPRRCNGRLVEKEPRRKEEKEPPLIEPDGATEPKKSAQEAEQKPKPAPEPKPKTESRRKRFRSPPEDEVGQMQFVRSPFACELITKSAKGTYSSIYVDIDLASLGLQPLVPENVITRKMAKMMVGGRCCYLRLGTAVVVSGCIVEVNIADSTAQIVPDRGLRLDVEWVNLRKLYFIPDDLSEIRKTVSEKVYTTLKRESEYSTINAQKHSVKSATQVVDKDNHNDDDHDYVFIEEKDFSHEFSSSESGI